MHTSNEAGEQTSAEQRFRDAFERLKHGVPQVLSSGTHISQNNVAKEAGCDPSALKKSRFPSLVSEIQHYISANSEVGQQSMRQKRIKKREKNRNVRELLHDVKQQRDIAQSKLADSNLLIVDLYAQIADLNRKIEELSPTATVIPFQPVI